VGVPCQHARMIPIVFVHGGGLDGRCWDPTREVLSAPSIAVDLPGRGAHPADLSTVTFADCAESVLADADDAGFDDFVLVGHSLAGCSMPSMIGLFGDRVSHAVYIACTVPESGLSAFDTLDPEVQAMAGEESRPSDVPRTMSGELAKIVLGNDLTDEQLAFCVERLVPEAPHLSNDPVDLSPLRADLPSTWVRTLQDMIVAADKQLRFAKNVGPDCRVIDLDAGHMCMVGQPENTAKILDDVAASLGG
jgi:pimeloyl-ACP methyl ester carboxylesterase